MANRHSKNHDQFPDQTDQILVEGGDNLVLYRFLDCAYPGNISCDCLDFLYPISDIDLQSASDSDSKSETVFESEPDSLNKAKSGTHEEYAAQIGKFYMSEFLKSISLGKEELYARIYNLADAQIDESVMQTVEMLKLKYGTDEDYTSIHSKLREKTFLRREFVRARQRLMENQNYSAQVNDMMAWREVFNRDDWKKYMCDECKQNGVKFEFGRDDFK
ncbi:uncharacterized protein V1516DRAFT_684213 [Lipomyces oligophaga]|uniref:uncharacterized protein n=1 Tax=Lipomyces oligophaga TaxID=45792 RepID=UPI0034CD6877